MYAIKTTESMYHFMAEDYSFLNILIVVPSVRSWMQCFRMITNYLYINFSLRELSFKS